MSIVWKFLTGKLIGAKPKRVHKNVSSRQRTADIEALCGMLREYEGLRLEPYADSAGHWTIGYGARWTLGGRQVTERTKPITQETANKMLWKDASKVYDRITKMLRPDATRGARICFSSLAFNVGTARVKKSNALRCYNARNLVTAKREHGEFRKAGGRVLKGLVRRRAAEWALVERDET